MDKSAKDEFISTVSHELRTPLTSIRGALALVVSGAAGTLPDKVQQLLVVAHRNSERLVHIVNDILDAEKVEAGKMRVTLQSVPVLAFLEQALVYNEPYAKKFGTRFTLQEAPANTSITADPDRLMQVMSNLLSNAAKFSPAGAETLIRAHERGGRIVIEVQDSGPGIPEDFMPHVFEKFAQARNSSAPKHEGTGLGLNLSRQLVELMQGEISFTTQPGRGTTFSIFLPICEEDAQPNTESRPEVA
ncbi:MAG: HAMP domain-containing sensor histidine kinase [Alphaproteobacteria bacterium]|nr:HAMP domain-containing sensor histidine kinase [Alphaproteobacteria bacterium]